jgi:hypothetical protein
MPITYDKVMITQEKIQYVLVEAWVRYWEDTSFNGVNDTEDGKLNPFNKNGVFTIRINVDTGQIEKWPENTTASFHYKVCDECNVIFLDKEYHHIKGFYEIYVPKFLCPIESGYGDYIIFDVNTEGIILGWNPNLVSKFLEEENE